MKYLVLALGLSSYACATPCGTSSQCTPIAADATAADVQAALVKAKPGDTVAFAEGTYKISAGLTLGTTNVTLKGQGHAKTTFDFSGQSGAQGLLVEGADKITIEGLSVKNTAGDGIKVKGGNGVVFRDVFVSWSGADTASHGAYGLYPVESKNVLIEDCEVRGASDAGIYVGQSDNIIVRNNHAAENVAGIEIENSTRADVTANTVEDNTGGILVFALPNLTKIATDGVRVYGNTVKNNNTKSFAAEGNVVASVPSGTGILTMAATNVEIFDNTIEGNDTIAASVVSYFFIDASYLAKDPTLQKLQPFSGRVSLHDNTFSANGRSPDQSKLSVLGLIQLLGGTPPEIFFENSVSPLFGASPIFPANPAGFCAQANTGVSLVGVYDTTTMGALQNQASFDCALPAVAAVSLE